MLTIPHRDCEQHGTPLVSSFGRRAARTGSLGERVGRRLLIDLWRLVGQVLATAGREWRTDSAAATFSISSCGFSVNERMFSFGMRG
jgi:hypothetical protein